MYKRHFWKDIQESGNAVFLWGGKESNVEGR